MQTYLDAFVHAVTTSLQVVAIAMVVIGSLRAVVDIARVEWTRRHDDPTPRTVWLEYARWLVAALTFQLAADIVATSFSPSHDELARLVVVAVVRTFLSYFLEREVDHARTALATARPGPAGVSPHDVRRSDPS